MSENEQRKTRAKTPAELEDQILDVSGELDELITPESPDEDIIKKDINEIRKKYKARYDIYLETLREKKTGKQISAEEKARRVGIIRALNNLDQYLSIHSSDEKKRTLWEKQVGVFEDMRSYLEEGGTEGYIKLPTGTGKTVIFTEFIEATGLKTLIVVPTTILIGQTEEKIQEFAKDLDVGKIYKDAKEHGHHVTITTYNSFVTGVESGKIKPEDYQLLILDEAHRALSKKRSDVVRKFNQHIKIGFTATPRYSDNKQVAKLLDTEIHSMTIIEAAKEGMLSPFSVIAAHTETDISKVEVVGDDYSEEELAKAINNQSRNQAAVNLYTQEFDGETAVAYCCGVNHATDLSKMFNEAGVPAAVIHGDMSEKEKDDIIQKYEDGDILVLCNSDILIEGFDEPRASVCLNLRPTLSPVVAEQRGGRVLRINKNNPKKFAKIIEFIDKNNEKKKLLVTFAQVAGSACVEGISGRDPVITSGSSQLKPILNIKNLKVVVDPEEVMRIVKQMEEQKYQHAPEGWQTYSEIALQIGKPETTVRRVAHRVRNEHAEYFAMYLDEKKQMREYLSPAYSQMIIDNYKNITNPPEGWITNSALSIAIGKSYSTVKNTAEGFRAAYPEWFKNYYSAKGRIDEHYSPELCLLITDALAEYGDAPTGWLPESKLAQQLGKANATIGKIADKYRTEHPEWFKEYLNPRGRRFEHYAPALIGKIEAEVNEYEDAPVGWLSMHGLHEKTKKTEIQISRKLDVYRAEHPEWFKEYYNFAGSVSEHYAPELVKIVIEEFGKVSLPPEGWLNATEAARQTGMGYRLFKVAIQKYADQFPDETGLFQSIKTDPIEFYSPRLVDLVNAEKKLNEMAPEGWMTSSRVAVKLRSGSTTVSAAAEKYRAEHPEWFKEYYQRSGNKYEHYSPELIEKITEDLRTIQVASADTNEKTRIVIEVAPPGWKTLATLRKEFKKADETIKTAAEKYRTEHPEWFKKYRPEKGGPAEYFAPELIEILASELNSHEVAPEGWFTNNGIQMKRGKQRFQEIKEIANKYRVSNPEWFKDYIAAHKQVEEFFAPELVKIIEDELMKLEKTLAVPEGWKASTSLVEDTGVAQQTISRNAEKYRSEHPEWFKDIQTGKVKKTYYSPELYEMLIKEFKKYEAPPAGWKSTNEIMLESGIKNFYRVKEIAEKYRTEHPEWFKHYKPIRGKPTEYYAPDLTKLVMDEITKS